MKLRVRWRRWRGFKKVHSYAKHVLSIWAKYGKGLFEDEEVVLARVRLEDIKLKFKDVFDKYNRKYCTACDGDCCYVYYGGYTDQEFAAMTEETRRLMGLLMVKTKKGIKECIAARRCMYHGTEVGCKLPCDIKSVLCTKFMCGIFKNVIRGEDRELIEQYTKEIDKELENLKALVDRKQKG